MSKAAGGGSEETTPRVYTHSQAPFQGTSAIWSPLLAWMPRNGALVCPTGKEALSLTLRNHLFDREQDICCIKGCAMTFGGPRQSSTWNSSVTPGGYFTGSLLSWLCLYQAPCPARPRGRAFINQIPLARAPSLLQPNSSCCLGPRIRRAGEPGSPSWWLRGTRKAANEKAAFLSDIRTLNNRWGIRGELPGGAKYAQYKKGQKSIWDKRKYICRG